MAEWLCIKKRPMRTLGEPPFCQCVLACRADEGSDRMTTTIAVTPEALAPTPDPGSITGSSGGVLPSEATEWEDALAAEVIALRKIVLRAKSDIEAIGTPWLSTTRVPEAEDAVERINASLREIRAAVSSPVQATDAERYYVNARVMILATAVGQARIKLASGDADGAREVLDDAAEKTRELLASALAAVSVPHEAPPEQDNTSGDAGGVRVEASGAELIAAERKRQVEAEGWTFEHDDEHEYGEMASAAAAYALPAPYRNDEIRDEDGRKKTLWFLLWPWSKRWWKPTPDNRVRELVKAGALIAAEIDRLQRLGLADGSAVVVEDSDRG